MAIWTQLLSTLIIHSSDMLMQAKTIKCPQCGSWLNVKNPRNEPIKQINCPQCGVLLQLRFHELNSQQSSPNTQVPMSDAQCVPIFKLNEKRYELKLGKNIVGRKATTSEATVQIDTPDRMMSRQHAVVTVSRTAKGSLHTEISNYQNKNATLVDGVPLLPDDRIRLMNQNVITMGETNLLYVEEKIKQE